VRMKINRIIIFANGALSTPFLKEIQINDYIIGVDRAAYWLIEHGIIPDVAIGDFDSVTKQEFTKIKSSIKHLLVFPAKKNETDLALAIAHAITKHPSEIHIYGSLGTRLDHSLVSIQMLEALSKQGIRAAIYDAKNMITVVDSQLSILKHSNFRYFSILPVTTTATISITGCLYPVKKTVVSRGESIGISNEIIGEKADITVHSGIIYIIRSRD